MGDGVTKLARPAQAGGLRFDTGDPDQLQQGAAVGP